MTTEQFSETVAYASTPGKTQKNGTSRAITFYFTCSRLESPRKIFCHWLNIFPDEPKILKFHLRPEVDA